MSVLISWVGTRRERDVATAVSREKSGVTPKPVRAEINAIGA
jgi:hypothetical protein